MRAIVIAVGDELISGATVDTNSAHVSAQLAARGVATARHVTVGDDNGAITSAIASAARDAELVILTGGLGPTADDLTRQGLASALGVDLVEDARSLERIAAFFAARGRELKPSNRTQALVPAGAEAIDNDCGTAPGIAARLGRAQVFALPGPPHEMRAMFESELLPRLSAAAADRQGAAGAIVGKLIHTFGTGESDVGEMISDLMARDADPKVGTTVKAGVITVRITAGGPDPHAARTAAERTAAEIRKRLGELVFAEDADTMPAAVGRLLRQRGQTLAVAESCTGGLVGKMITDVPGASEYFLGGVVAYADRAKTALVGVPEELVRTCGAVSEPVAAALAAGARERFGSDYGLGVTGIAGPGGGSPRRGSPDKPVGLVYVALASPGGTAVARHVFPGTRDIVRRRAALAALNHLRLALAGGQGP